MNRTILVAVTLVLAAFASMPVVDAHQCGGDNCGPCTDGEFHQHGGPEGGCQSSAGLPGFTGVLAVAGVLVAALVVARTR